jgi:hypothetical protein
MKMGLVTAILPIILLSKTAIACDLTNYDRSAPPAIRSEVDNGSVHFEWATDVDNVSGRNWIWHYIRNMHDRGLAYRWPKADLRRAVGSGLAAGKIDCQRYFVARSTVADDDAPITYGTSSEIQRASVFIGDAKSASVEPAAGTVVETSYENGLGSIEDVRVGIFTQVGSSTTDRLTLQIEKPNDIAVAISVAPKFFNLEQYNSLRAQLERQSMRLGLDQMRKLTGIDEHQALAGL